MKKNLTNLLSLFICLFLVFSITGCENENNEDINIHEQIDSWDNLGELAEKNKYDLKIEASDTISWAPTLYQSLINYTNNNGNVWFSGASNYSNVSHYIILDLGKAVNVHKIALKPYIDEENSVVQCMPNDFTISYCIEKGKWSEILSYDNYQLKGNIITEGDNKYAEDEEFGFGGFVTARYLKVAFSDLTCDPFKAYLVKLCNFKAYVTDDATELDIAYRNVDELKISLSVENFTVDASSVNDADPTAPFKISSLSDKDYSSLWCAEWLNESSPECDEYIDITAEDNSIVKFTKVVLYANTDNSGFPCDFDFQYSIDNGDFVTAYSYTNYKNPAGEKDSVNVFEFSEPIVADTLRIQINKRSIAGNYYVIILGEVETQAMQASTEDIAAGLEKYLSLVGLTDAEVFTDDKNLAVLFIIISSLITLSGVVLLIFSVKKQKTIKKKGDN